MREYVKYGLGLLAVFCLMPFGHEYLYRDAERELMDELTLRTAKALYKGGITYWATSGTLFGVHLDKRTRYADFDGDLSVLVADADAVRRLPWESHGLKMYEGFGGFRIKVSTRGTLRVDLILVYEDKACECLRFGWPALEVPPFTYELVPSKFIFPLQKTEFASGTISVPNRTHDMLRWQYGDYKPEPPAGLHQLVMSTIEKHLWTRMVIPHIHLISPTMPY